MIVPINRKVAIQLADPPEGVDRSLWLYELCRFLTMKVNNLIIAFFAENPPCSAQTCPEMRASEWQYLCAVHDPPKSCCAIDYCCHTLDWATNTLTSPKYFPSRLTLGSENAGGPQASMRHLTNIFRRLYRIFAHAWFQHRDVFWEVEGHDGLYVFFKTVCDMYSLIPHDNYTIPREAEGPDAVQEPAEEESVDSKRLTILRKEDENPFGSAAEGLDPALGTGATTRRHKHSPSTGSRVTTITEGAEDLEESPQTISPLREALEQSPEPRPVSVLEVSTETAASDVTDEESNEVGEPSEEPLEESGEQPPQEPEAQPSELPKEQEKAEESDETKKLDSEKSDTKTEVPVEESATEDKEEATSSEQPEAAQEPSTASEAKSEPVKEDS